MPKSPKTKTLFGIFLSSTDDPVVRQYRLAARDVIQEAEFRDKWFAVEMSSFGPGTPPPLETCRKQVLDCSVYIGILGPIYGTVNDEVDLSYTEYEYTVARDAQDREIAIFLLPDDVIQLEPPDLIKKQGKLFDRQEEFRNAVTSKTHTVAKVTDLEQFRAQLAQYLRALPYPPRATTPPLTPEATPFSSSATGIGFDRQSVLGYSLSDMDATLIENVLQSAEAQRELARVGALRAPREQQLRLLGLINDDGRLSVGAFLCFAPASLLAARFSAIGLHLVAYDGSQKASSRSRDMRESYDNLIRLFDEGVEFLRRNLDLVGIAGSDDRDDLEVPFVALREALANALVHRDYDHLSSREQPTRIEIFTDRIEITSYGALVGGISVEALNEDPEHVKPRRRNPNITTIFRLMRLIELNASGIARMQEYLRRAQLRPAEITQQDGDPPSVIVTFYRPDRQPEPAEAAAGADRLDPPLDLGLLTAPSTFVGREQELGLLYQRLRTGQSASITALAGMGGIGKTALAAEVIRRLRDDGAFPDGIAVINCANDHDPNDIVRRALSRFDPRRRTPSTNDLSRLADIAQTLFRGKRALVVLDDIEPTLPVERVTRPLAAAGATLLLIARHIFPAAAVPAEGMMRLDPLPPDEALLLFAQTYGRKQIDDFAPDEREAAIRIMSLLGYNTYAIQLVAAYAANLSRPLSRVADEIASGGIVVLGDEATGNVRAVLARSIDTLPPDDQRLFVALAAFATVEFGRQAALAVATSLALPDPAASIDLMLRRALLETYVVDSLPTQADTERLRMHSLLHAEARERLATWSTDDTQSLHSAIANWYVVYMHQVNSSSVIGYRALIPDAANITAALDWAIADGDDSAIAILCDGLKELWRDMGQTEMSLRYLPPGVAAAERVAGRTRSRHDRLRQAAIMAYYGEVLLITGRTDMAENISKQVLDIHRDLDDQKGQGAALINLGRIASYRGNWRKASGYFRQGLSLRHMAGDRRGESVALFNLGQVALQRGQLDEAQTHFQQSLAILRELGDRQGEGALLCSLGQVALQRGQLDEAQTHFQQSLAINQEFRDRQGETVGLSGLGHVALRLGRLEEAEDHFQQSLAILRQIGDRQGEGALLFSLGRVAQERGALQEAQTYFQRAKEVWPGIGPHDERQPASAQVLHPFARLRDRAPDISEVVEATGLPQPASRKRPWWALWRRST